MEEMAQGLIILIVEDEIDRHPAQLSITKAKASKKVNGAANNVVDNTGEEPAACVSTITVDDIEKELATCVATNSVNGTNMELVGDTKIGEDTTRKFTFSDGYQRRKFRR